MGFEQTSSDPCLYVHLDSEGVMFLVAVYVDDIVLGGRREAKMNAVKEELSQKFEMKDPNRTTPSLPRSKSHSRSPHWSHLDWPTLIYRENATKVWNV